MDKERNTYIVAGKEEFKIKDLKSYLLCLTMH